MLDIYGQTDFFQFLCWNRQGQIKPNSLQKQLLILRWDSFRDVMVTHHRGHFHRFNSGVCKSFWRGIGITADLYNRSRLYTINYLHKWIFPQRANFEQSQYLSSSGWPDWLSDYCSVSFSSSGIYILHKHTESLFLSHP